MVFSSVTFIFFFLPFALAVYFLPWNRWKNATLLALSLFFYAWTEKGYLSILAVSILVNYLLSLGLCQTKRALLVLGVAFNLGLLALYKYSNFLVDNLTALMSPLGLDPIEIGEVYTPIGISFFTFHALSYLIDIYRGTGAVEKNPLRLALYLSLFPKILAGPIVPYRIVQSELGSRSVTAESFALGIERFILGLGKKVLLANPLAAVADKVFGMPAGDLAFDSAWIGIICYSLQIFFDFAGYSDMAIGLGRMFGFHFPENFDYPYISQSIQEFWRRWHISLSTWLRDYLYIPLGGNRCSRARQYFNLCTVFLLCGLWHGASWSFVVWGLWYGIFLVLERAGLASLLHSVSRPLRHCYALAVIVVGWVFFRSETLSFAFAYLKAMCGLTTSSGQYHTASLLVNNEVILCLAIGVAGSVPLLKQLRQWAWERPIRTASGAIRTNAYSIGLASVYALILCMLFLLSCMSLAGGTHKAFIYFKF